MGNVRKAAVLAALGIGFGAGSAWAAVLTASFDFHGTTGASLSHNFVNGGLSLAVTGLSGSSAANVMRSIAGLGVVTTGDTAVLNTYLNGDETLVFSFIPWIKLDEVVFKNVDNVADDDELLLKIVGHAGAPLFSGNLFMAAVPVPDGAGHVLWHLDLATLVPNPMDRAGVTFQLSSTDSNDDFTVYGMTVKYSDTGGPIVPLPAAGFAGLALLGALGVRRIRRA